MELSSPPDKLLPIALALFVRVCPSSCLAIAFPGYFGNLRRLHFILAGPSGTLQKDTRLEVNSYKLGAQPDHSVEDVAPSGLSPAKYLECILSYSHEHSSQNSAFPSMGSVLQNQRIHCTIGKPESDFPGIPPLLTLCTVRVWQRMSCVFWVWECVWIFMIHDPVLVLMHCAQ